MTESDTDDAQLRTTEAQMRQALGLNSQASPQTASEHPPPLTNGSYPQRRRFVRDGEIPVTLLHRDHHPDGETGINQLDATRQALRSETAARERAERSLEEAQATIRDLQTKLAHERLAKDEADARAETDRQALQQTLQSVQAELATARQVRRNVADKPVPAIVGTASVDHATKAPRRRGRPPKVQQDDSDIVEWWVPGWQGKFR
jgi:septal ring factor EnvC (AmiA/AmiB activator)